MPSHLKRMRLWSVLPLLDFLDQIVKQKQRRLHRKPAVAAMLIKREVIFSSTKTIIRIQVSLILFASLIGKYQKSSEARRTAADPNRPYECSKCGRNYKRKNHLTRHSAHECVGVVIPSQPYECSECGRRYKRKDHLLRHSAHECVGIGRSFSCTECDYRAKRKHHLTRHLSRVHKIDHPPSVFRT